MLLLLTPKAALERSAALAATALVATAGQRELERAAGLTATGTIATSGVVVGGVLTHTRSVSLSATAAVAVAGRRDLHRSSALTGVGAISTGRQVEFQRSLSLVVAATSLTVSGIRVGLVGPVEGVGSLESSGGMSASESSSGVIAMIE